MVGQGPQGIGGNAIIAINALAAEGCALHSAQLLTQQETRQGEPRLSVRVLVLLLDLRKDHVLFVLWNSAM